MILQGNTTVENENIFHNKTATVTFGLWIFWMMYRTQNSHNNEQTNKVKHDKKPKMKNN